MTKEQLKSKVEELQKELDKFKKELDEKDKSPYGELIPGEIYFTVNSIGEIVTYKCGGTAGDRKYYKNAKYFSDKSFAKKVAAEQTLTNLLRKYTYEHGWSDDLRDKHFTYHVIYYNSYHHKFLTTFHQGNEMLGSIYFIDRETAQNAIQKVVIPFVKEHPELGYELKD